MDLRAWLVFHFWDTKLQTPEPLPCSAGINCTFPFHKTNSTGSCGHVQSILPKNTNDKSRQWKKQDNLLNPPFISDLKFQNLWGIVGLHGFVSVFHNSNIQYDRRHFRETNWFATHIISGSHNRLILLMAEAYYLLYITEFTYINKSLCRTQFFCCFPI